MVIKKPFLKTESHEEKVPGAAVFLVWGCCLVFWVSLFLVLFLALRV